MERQYWMSIWDKLFVSGIPDSWAYRWTLVCMANSGLTALPNKNLVVNIGFDDDATHTKKSHFCPLKSEGLSGAISHPGLVVRDNEADQYSFEIHYGGAVYRKSMSVLWRWRRRLQLVIANPLHYPKKMAEYFAR